MTYHKERISLFTRCLGLYYVALILGAFNIGSIGSLLRIIGIVPILIWAVQYKGRIRNNKITIPVFLFVIFVGLSYFWSIDKGSTSQRIVTQFSFLLLTISASTYNYSSDEVKYLKSMLIWSSRISVASTIIFADYFQGRMYLHGLLREDPNYLCAYFMFGVVACIERIISDEWPLKKKLLPFGEIMLYAYTIISTGSRGGAIAVLVGIIVCYYNLQNEKGISLRRIVGPIILIISAGVLFYLLSNHIAPDILNRYSLSSLTRSDGTGRYRIWSDAMRTYKEAGLFRQLLGFGSGSALAIARSHNFFFVNVMHNAFIENLLEIGLLGVVWYVVYVFRSWNSARIMRDYFSFSVISGMIVLSFSTSIGAFKPYWNIILFIICLGNLLPEASE